MLVDLLGKMSNSEYMCRYIDELMQNANTKNFKEISTDIVKAFLTLIFSALTIVGAEFLASSISFFSVLYE